MRFVETYPKQVLNMAVLGFLVLKFRIGNRSRNHRIATPETVSLTKPETACCDVHRKLQAALFQVVTMTRKVNCKTEILCPHRNYEALKY